MNLLVLVVMVPLDPQAIYDIISIPMRRSEALFIEIYALFVNLFLSIELVGGLVQVVTVKSHRGQ